MTTNEEHRQDNWWQRELEDAYLQLEAQACGLSAQQVQARLLRYGRNQFRDQPRSLAVVEIAKRFRNPLIALLLVAGAISASTGDHISASIIAVMVVLSVVLDYVQEHRAQATAQKLKESVQLRAKALRDGQETVVPVEMLVPGDVVLLSAGCQVPADGLVIQAKNLFVKQAALTGEPFPVGKRSGPPAKEAELDTATAALFMGSSVLSGGGTMLVCKTGDQTQIGNVSALVLKESGESSFELGIRRFGYLILRVTLLLVLFVVLANGLVHRPVLDSFLFALALAVGLTPELLPMIVTVTLSSGAIRMAHEQVIVKRLSAIQNLGAMNVLCTDKTGTLTEAKISLAQHTDINGQDSARALELAYLNSFFESGLRTPLEEAILVHDHMDPSAWQKLDEVPFDFERRRLSVLLQGPKRLLVVKGAPEDVLGHCNRVETSGGLVLPWSDSAREAIDHTLAEMGKQGYRVLGVAWKEVPAQQNSANISDETELVFTGFAAFLDPPKQDSAKIVQDLQHKGVAVKVLTGDNELVTQYICKSLNIPITGILMGHEVAKLDDQALALRVLKANIFCRVNPVQKNRIVQALRSRGKVVGYLGDGINDAPALHSADVGISVDTAVDVAKEAADLILLRHDLSALNKGVTEGRRTFANIRKYIMMGTSSNFGNMLSMAGAALLLPFLPMLPTQILLNNILYDLSGMVLPLDHVDKSEIAQPQHWDIDLLRNFMWVMGPVSSLFDFLTFFILLKVLQAAEPLFQTGWFLESLATQTLVIFVIRTRGNPLVSRAHPALAIAVAVVLLVAAVLPYTVVGHWFGFVPLPTVYFWVLLALVITYLLLAQAIKLIFFRLYMRRRKRAK